MKFSESLKNLMVDLDHVEETAEGLLHGGFAVIDGGDNISPLGNTNCNCDCICEDNENCNCRCDHPAPTSKVGSHSGMPGSLSF